MFRRFIEKIRGSVKRPDVKSLRFKLTAAFVLFALLLMGGIWTFQYILLDRFYQNSMEKKAAEAVKTVKTVYANSEGLCDYDVLDCIIQISKDNDIFFFIEDSGQTYRISSADEDEAGRVFRAGRKNIIKARTKLETSEKDSVRFIIDSPKEERLLIYASKIRNSYGEKVYLYAIAPLTPMGPAAEILSNLFFTLTIIALFLSVVFALIYSKRFTKPLSGIANAAKGLGKGNYDVRFDTKGAYTEISELAEVLNGAAVDLAKADALQKDLLANVSHDLRTPLTMVKSYAEMIRDISGDDKARRDEHLGVIIEEADRLSDLVGDVLQLSKMQSGTMEFEMKPFDIQAAAKTILETYKVLESENYSFEFIKVPGKPMVNGSESRMQQVFSNLISNAVRYSKKDGGNIVLRLEEPSEGKIKCSVEDDGIGIAKEDLESIWSRYQKASKQNRRAPAGSTGLGLSIVREILERHGAVYGVESEEGKGSKFWFTMSCEFKR